MKLTVIDKELDDRAARTPRGMAYWIGTYNGDIHDATCRKCKFYTFEGYKANRGNRGGMLKDGRCEKYASLMQAKGPTISFELSACKYFEQNPAPPAIINPRK